MPSEKTTATESPAREPSQDTAPKEPPSIKSPPADLETREPAEEAGDDAASSDAEPTESKGSQSPATDKEQGEITEDPPLPDEELPSTNPPLPDEAPPGTNPPLPSEPAPGAAAAADDGWDYRWDYGHARYIFFNRFTGAETFENPRIASDDQQQQQQQQQQAAPDPPVITGYNPAIHGDYDPNAWYAKLHEDPAATTAAAQQEYDNDGYDATALFNRFTGQHQAEGAARHGDEAKSRRQMNAYFDVDAAANAHDGRSLKAERSGKKPSKNELRFFKEKRRARKEEKRRAWLRD